MGNPFTFAICVAAALIVATGAVGAEKKQPAQYIKPDPATALLEFDYNLFKVSKWASERGKEQTAAAPHFQDLRSSVDLYRQFFRRNLAITASKPTQVTEPIILLNIDANEKTLKKKSGVNRVIIDLEPAEIEIAQAITQAAKIETDPNYQSPVYFCLNDYWPAPTNDTTF
jgi:hypothetical protein